MGAFIPIATFPHGHLRLAETSTYGQCSSPGDLLYLLPGVSGPGNRFQVAYELEKEKMYLLFLTSNITCVVLSKTTS